MKKHIVHLNDTPFVKFTFLFKNFTMNKYLKEINSFIDSLDDFKKNNDGPIFLKNNGYNIDFEYKKEKNLKMIKIGSFFYKETKDELLIVLKENSLFGTYLKNKNNNETYVVSNVPLHDSFYSMKSLYIEEQLTTAKPINIIKNNETITLTLKNSKILDLMIENTSLFEKGILESKQQINMSNEKNVKSDFIKKISVFVDDNEKKIYELELKNCQFKKVLINEKNKISKIKFSSDTLTIISNDLPLATRKKINNIILPSGEVDSEALELLNEALRDRKDIDLITEDKSQINIITLENVINEFNIISQKNEITAIPNNVMNFNEEFLNKIAKPITVKVLKEKTNLFNIFSYEENVQDPHYESLKFENIDTIWNTIKNEIAIPYLENKKSTVKKLKP